MKKRATKRPAWWFCRRWLTIRSPARVRMCRTQTWRAPSPTITPPGRRTPCPRPRWKRWPLEHARYDLKACGLRCTEYEIMLNRLWKLYQFYYCLLNLIDYLLGLERRSDISISLFSLKLSISLYRYLHTSLAANLTCPCMNYLFLITSWWMGIKELSSTSLLKASNKLFITPISTVLIGWLYYCMSLPCTMWYIHFNVMCSI